MMLVAGLNHITANAEQQVDDHMPDWKEFLLDLKALGQWAGCQDRLNRFVETCVDGTNYDRYKQMFQKKLPEIAEWRWGTVHQVLEAVQRILPPLRMAWDPAKYNDRSEGREAPDTGQVVPAEQQGNGAGDRYRQLDNCAVLTRIIRSNFFSAFVDMALLVKTLPRALLAMFEGARFHSC
jgi:hypothetical protein